MNLVLSQNWFIIIQPCKLIIIVFDHKFFMSLSLSLFSLYLNRFFYRKHLISYLILVNSSPSLFPHSVFPISFLSLLFDFFYIK